MTKPFLTALIAVAMTIGNCEAQTAPAIPDEIHQLYVSDQADRGVVMKGAKPKEVTPEQMSANDVNRRKRAHELLDRGTLQSGADFHDAAFIFQHGETPEDYLLAHVLAMVAVNKGDKRGRWIDAATLDRYLQAIGQPQVFGTQFLTQGYIEFMNQIRTNKSTKKEVASSEASQGQAKTTPEDSKPHEAASTVMTRKNGKCTCKSPTTHHSSVILCAQSTAFLPSRNRSRNFVS